LEHVNFRPGTESFDLPGDPHFPETVPFRRKTSGKRDDVDNISSSGSDITDSSTESGDCYGSEREWQLEREWEEGMEQLKTITTTVLLPLFGKWLGKKWAYLSERVELVGATR
jgi:hypothetical protein